MQRLLPKKSPVAWGAQENALAGAGAGAYVAFTHEVYYLFFAAAAAAEQLLMFTLHVGLPIITSWLLALWAP